MKRDALSLNVNGVRMHVQSAGQGPAVPLLRAFFGAPVRAADCELQRRGVDRACVRTRELARVIPE